MGWLQHRITVTVGVLFVGATLIAVGLYQKFGYFDRVAAGVKATEQGRFDNRDFERAARNLFASQALLAYNRGVRAAAAGRLRSAAAYFREVLSGSDSPTLKAKAHYNLGNLRALEGKGTEAAAMYREALRLDPSDWDAKYNLEALFVMQLKREDEGTNAALQQAPGSRDVQQGAGSSGSSDAGKAGI